ncbi:MAG: hypothetical protein WD022_07180 [Balneolaceae bacterium]
MKGLKFSSLAIVLALIATTAFAQTQTDAVKAYNAGLEAASAENFDDAISSLTQALTIAEQLGPEGEEVKGKVENQLPTVYYKKAVSYYNAFKGSKDLEDLDTAIEAFKEAASVGEEYNDERISTRAKSVIPQLYYQASVTLYSQGELEEANEAVDKALNENANYAVAYYQKAKIFKKLNDTEDDGIIDQGIDEMLEWYDRAISVGEATNKGDIVAKSREAAHDELLAVGTQALQDGETKTAIETLNKALNYNAESADVYYRLAEAHNKAGDAAKAVANAREALNYENGGKTDKAKIYFELGYAHQTLGNKSDACDAFTNALYGSFKSPAEHKMEYELKCDSTAP